MHSIMTFSLQLWFKIISVACFPRAAVFEFSLDCPFFLELGKFRIEPLDISKKPKHKFKWANDDTLKNHSFSVPDIPFPDTRRFQIFMIEYARVNYYWGSLILRRDAWPFCTIPFRTPHQFHIVWNSVSWNRKTLFTGNLRRFTLNIIIEKEMDNWSEYERPC